MFFFFLSNLEDLVTAPSVQPAFPLLVGSTVVITSELHYAVPTFGANCALDPHQDPALGFSIGLKSIDSKYVEMKKCCSLNKKIAVRNTTAFNSTAFYFNFSNFSILSRTDV